MPNKKEIEFNSFLDELESSKPIEESSQDKEKEFESFLDGLEVGEESVKKKDIPSESLVSEFQFQEVDVNTIQAELYDGYFESQVGIIGPVKASQKYTKAKEKGLDNISAAREAGIPIMEEVGPEGVVERVAPPIEWGDMEEEAKQYVEGNMKRVLEDRINSNIEGLKGILHSQSKFKFKSDDFLETQADARKKLGQQILLRRKYGLVETEEDVSQEVWDIKSMTIGDFFGDGTSDERAIQDGGRIFDKPVPKMSMSEFEKLISSNPTEFDPININPSKKKELESLEIDRVLFKEAGMILSEAKNLEHKADDPDGFFTSIVTSFAGHFVNIGESVNNISKHIGIGAEAQDVRETRSKRKEVLARVYEKFTKIGAGNMAVEDLSDSELSLYLASLSAGELMETSADKIPFGTNLGESLGHALGFVAEIYLTGGTTAAARTATKHVVLSRLATSGAPSLGATFAANATAAITAATIQTAKMPSFFSSSLNRYTEGEDMGNAIINGYFDTYPDILASNIFVMPMSYASGLSSGAQKFWSRTNSIFGADKSFKGFLKANLKEFTEEQFASMGHAYVGAGSIQEFHDRMPTLKQQVLIGSTTSIFASFGVMSNAVDRVKTGIDLRKAGRTLGPIKQDVDIVLQNGETGFRQALDIISESIDGYAKDAAEWANLYTAAAKYLTNHKIMKSWDVNRPSNTNRTIDDGNFIEGEAVGDVMGKDKGFVVRHDKLTDKETITLSSRVSNILGRFAAFENVSRAEMEFARDQLTTMEPFLTEAKNKAVVKEFINDFNDIIGDMKNTSELINEVRKKPRFTSTEAEIPLAEGETLIQEKRIDIDGRRSGYAQEVKVGDVTKYNLFSNSKRLIGQYDTKDALGEGLKKYTAERAARRIKKDVVNEGTPKEYIKELKAKLHEAAKKRTSSNPLEGLEAKRDVADALNTYVTRGKMTSDQAIAITKFMAKLDLTRPVQRSQFLSYAEAVLDDAENILNYDNRVKRRGSVLRTAKRKTVSPDVAKLAKEFGKLKPLEVADHAKYMEHADALMAGMSRSKGDKVTGDVKQRKTLIVADTQAYVDSEMQRQAEAEATLQKQINKELTGYEDVSLESIRDMADHEVKELLDDAGVGSPKEAVKQWIEGARPKIRAILKGKELLESGEPLDMTEHGKRMVDQFMKLNIDNLSDVQALRVLDGLDSFLKNGTLFGMEHAVMMAEGVAGPSNLIKIGNTGKTFWTVYPTETGSRFLGEKIASLPIFLENVFRGMDNANRVTKASGLRDIMVGYSKAAGRAQQLAIDFNEKFGGTDVNGQNFMSRRNIFERGLWSELIRDSESETAQENFEKSKKQIYDSMIALEGGSKIQKEMGAIYRTLYTEFLEGSETLADTRAKMSEKGQTNIDAVEWWINEFKDVAPHLKALVEGVHNKSLNLESYYTPRTYRKINPDLKSSADIVEEFKNSAFQERTGSLAPKQAGILMGKKDFTDVPTNKYIDLNFDHNMGSAMEAGLLDLYTSPHVVKLAAFVNAPGYEALFGDKETADIFKTRVLSYVHDIYGKKSVKSSKYMKKLMPFIQQYAATRALGRSTMAAQQMAPVALNTFFNTGNLDLSSMYGKDANAINKFIDGSGYGIALRGSQSRGDLPTPEEFSSSEWALTKLSRKVSNKYLDLFLIDRDRRIARASWMTYYKKRLRRLGVDTKNIDWETHKIDNAKHRKAADYAEHMVNRQQNVSDAALMGEFLKSKGDGDKMLRATFFVFANFVMNQKMRMQTDIAIAADPATSFEDRMVATRSLLGLAAEQAAFHSLGSYFRFLMQDLANFILGVDESEEDRDERKRKRDRKTLQYFATDLLSPAPLIDKPFVAAGRTLEYLLDDITGEESEEYLFNNYGGDDIFEAFGVISMGVEDVKNTINMGYRAIAGDYRKTFSGNVTKKYLTVEERQLLGVATAARILHAYGLLPTDAKMWADYTMRAIDKQAETLPAMERRQKKHNERLKEIRDGSRSGTQSTSVGRKKRTAS